MRKGHPSIASRSLDVTGKKRKGRPCKNWTEVLKKDLADPLFSRDKAVKRRALRLVGDGKIGENKTNGTIPNEMIIEQSNKQRTA